jgi:pyruvate dehydrogenase E1 component
MGARWPGWTTRPLRAFLARVPFFAQGPRRYADAAAARARRSRCRPTARSRPRRPSARSSTIWRRATAPLAARIVTTSPDVTGTTNLGPWVNRRKLFARREMADAFIEHASPRPPKWEFAPEGQHLELGIAEMNLFLLLGARGLSHSLFGKRLIPIGTVYDPFVRAASMR